MILINQDNKNQILSFLPLIRDNPDQWHVINLKLDTDSEEEARSVVVKFVEEYTDNNGFAYIESNQKVIGVIHLGIVESYSSIQKNIERKIDDKRCIVRAQKMTKNGLKQIEIKITKGKSKNSDLFGMRENRARSVVAVVDDDMFIRKTVSSFLNSVSEVHEFEDAPSFLEQYAKVNPDIVILDIHLPKTNGLDVIDQVVDEDSNAFILISSADSTAENVQKAINNGAAGFLAKPVHKKRLMDYTQKCLTFSDSAAF